MAVDEEHKRKCGGTFEKVAEPEGYKPAKKRPEPAEKLDRFVKIIPKEEKPVKRSKQAEEDPDDEDLALQMALLDFLNLK